MKTQEIIILFIQAVMMIQFHLTQMHKTLQVMMVEMIMMVTILTILHKIEDQPPHQEMI